jgi:hypothetical protein
VPFVQGHLWEDPFSLVITTECAHTGRVLHLEFDSDMNYRVVDERADPVLFVPLVDVSKLEDPSIIDAF